MGIASLHRLALFLCLVCFGSVTWFALDHANRASHMAGRFADDHMAASELVSETQESLAQARQICAYMIDDRLVPFQDVLLLLDDVSAQVERERAALPPLAALAGHLARLRSGLLQIEAMRQAGEFSDTMTQTVAAVKAHLGAVQDAAAPAGLAGMREEEAVLLRGHAGSLANFCKRYLRAKPDRLPAFLGLMDKIAANLAELRAMPVLSAEALAMAAFEREASEIKAKAVRLRVSIMQDPEFSPSERKRQTVELRTLWDRAAHSAQALKDRHARALRSDAEANVRAIDDANRLFMLLPAGCLALALALLLVTRKRFSGEMELFKSAAGRIAQGRLDSRIQPMRGGVLGELAQAFNLMAERLEEEHARAGKAMEKLTLSHGLLDMKVRERTRELTLALESLRLKDSFFQHSKEGFVVCDESLRIIDANQAMTHLTGYGLEALAGLAPDAFCHKSSAASFRDALARALDSEGRYEGETELVTRQGRMTPVKVLFARLGGDEAGKRRHVGIFLDVSARRGATAGTGKSVRADAQPGLPDRDALLAALPRRLDEARARGHSLAVILLGLDGFKSVNSTAGHAAGDALLNVAGLRIASCVRKDGLAARLGGDEFAVVAGPLESEALALATAKRVLGCFREPFRVSGETRRLGASIGVAVFPGDGQDARELVKNAGLALLRAKHHGRGRIEMFTQELDAHFRERMALERDLHEAVQERRFQVHYQPIVDAGSPRVAGAEALLRWTRDGEPVSPGVFIPLCEELDIMGEVTALLLDTATRDMKDWEARGLTPHVSVNISAPQFCEPGFTDRFAAALRARAVPCARVGLEITETAIMQDPAGAAETLRLLRERGHSISVDDFGTGYSSLRYLQKFPLTALKIDRQFVKDLEFKQSRAIVRATIAMARGLGLTVIAEGVETPRQLDILRAEGCDCYQGFLFSPALPAKDFVALLERETPEGRFAQPARSVGKGSVLN